MDIKKETNDLLIEQVQKEKKSDAVTELLRRYCLAIEICEHPHHFGLEQVWNADGTAYTIQKKDLDKSK